LRRLGELTFPPCLRHVAGQNDELGLESDNGLRGAVQQMLCRIANVNIADMNDARRGAYPKGTNTPPATRVSVIVATMSTETAATAASPLPGSSWRNTPAMSSSRS
jgi:hypothetical protein